MRHDLTDLRLFLNVGETLNLTRAAERTFLSLPAASARVKHMEEAFKARLLVRLATGVALTPAGEGARVEILVGNKRPIPAIGRPAAPVRLRGVVGAVTDGQYVITGPTYTGQTACMGRSAVLDIGAAKLHGAGPAPGPLRPGEVPDVLPPGLRTDLAGAGGMR
ncbi:hypothetical protein G6F22_020033 [Rhizopus arrhizus]|nr:hypothetical protein G6F22_020033 [Rhizopus arrhizus]